MRKEGGTLEGREEGKEESKKGKERERDLIMFNLLLSEGMGEP